MKSMLKGALGALMVVLALSAAVSASASAALPEFATGPGEKLTETKYKMREGLPWTGWETTQGDTFACSDQGAAGKSTFEGSFLGPKTVSGKFVFTRCSLGCKSEGAKLEEIATVELEGTLVYISKATKKVGITFKPKSGKYLTKFKYCDGFPGEVKGSIIIPLRGELNTLAYGFGVGPLNETKGIQQINQYENEEGKLVSSELSTEWPSGRTILPLAWDWRYENERYNETNKKLEIKA